MKKLRSVTACWALCLGAVLGFESSSVAQPCGLAFSPNPGTASVTIESYWQINGYVSASNLALFRDTVTTGNSTVPPGVYLGWCIDTTDGIDNGPEGYSVLMFSSCDPNLDAELADLGYTYHFTYPSTDTNTSAAQWNQLNYILNHPLSGASYWDIQAAIWSIVGGPLPPNSYYQDNYSSSLIYNTSNVSTMVNNALANAGAWQPQCGDVIAVVLAITAKDKQYGDFPVQLTIIQVPFPCVPTLKVGAIGSCYTSLTNADAAALAATTGTGGCNGGGFTFTVSDNGQYCPATITVKGTDACGNSATTSYTATILTNLPTFSGLPAATTTNYLCDSDVPPAPTVTATDSCGTSLTVIPSSTDTGAGTCHEVITLTWTATDCADQQASFTETITVTNTQLPALTQGSISNCYTSLTNADAAALAATTGTANCGGKVMFTVSDNGQYCPATITVTGTDNCGLASTVTYTATILTGPPTLSAYPTNITVQCAGQIPTAPAVTAADSCGTALTVSSNQVESNPASTCSNVITRTWSATDCASQTVSWTQVITQLDNVTLTLNKGPIASCYTSLAAADAAAQAATTGAGGCGSSLTFTVSDNGQYCPATITVKGIDGCSNSATVTYTARILTAAPTLLGLPSAATNYTCYAQVPSVPIVTAVDSCGAVIAVIPTSQETYLGTSCNNTITRTWTATDCANQTTSFTQTITVKDTVPPTLTGVPANTVLPGCNGATNLPGDAAISNDVKAAACGPVAISVTHLDATNGCGGTRVFTIKATDGCNNTTSTNVTYSWTVYSFGPTVNCPSNVTIVTNLCQMYCTFSAGDWGGSCDGGWYNNNNWWQNWCAQNPPSQSWPSWTNWWKSCSGNGTQCTNFWNGWNNSHPTNWWGCWSGNQSGNQWGGQSGNWWNSWNNANYGSQSWVPCAGNNPDSILNNYFTSVYPKGCVTVGLPGNGKSVSFTSCSAAKTCLNWGGNPGVLSGCATNPSYCGAGSFCAQVLALKLNCDFGDYGCAPGLVGKCGDLVLCDSTSPCNGQKVRDILGICNSALGGGSCPQGCTVQYLSALCGNLNQCFEGCQVSGWCSSHLCSVYIPSPALTGTATVSDACSPNPTLTYCDTVSVGNCAATYVVNREWIAVDACGNSNTCTQTITVTSSLTNKCVTNEICGNFNSQNPGGGYVWCNAHVNCNPGKKCTIYCQNATVTLSCNDGKTYTYPVPDGQINFSPSCSTGSCVFDGTKWTTTLPCSGDDEIFLSGCGIPWRSDFANCRSVCWTGTFSCDTAGINCNWQWSGACYSSNLGNCGSVSVKPCHQTSCGYPSGDHAGTPENCKYSCQGGACGGGGGNYTGSWSSTGSCSF